VVSRSGGPAAQGICRLHGHLSPPPTRARVMMSICMEGLRPARRFAHTLAGAAGPAAEGLLPAGCLAHRSLIGHRRSPQPPASPRSGGCHAGALGPDTSRYQTEANREAASSSVGTGKPRSSPGLRSWSEAGLTGERLPHVGRQQERSRRPLPRTATSPGPPGRRRRVPGRPPPRPAAPGTASASWPRSPAALPQSLGRSFWSDLIAIVLRLFLRRVQFSRRRGWFRPPRRALRRASPTLLIFWSQKTS
jgi:hypothetical protein